MFSPPALAATRSLPSPDGIPLLRPLSADGPRVGDPRSCRERCRLQAGRTPDRLRVFGGVNVTRPVLKRLHREPDDAAGGVELVDDEPFRYWSIDGLRREVPEVLAVSVDRCQPLAIPVGAIAFAGARLYGNGRPTSSSVRGSEGASRCPHVPDDCRAKVGPRASATTVTPPVVAPRNSSATATPSCKATTRRHSPRERPAEVAPGRGHPSMASRG